MNEDALPSRAVEHIERESIQDAPVPRHNDGNVGKPVSDAKGDGASSNGAKDICCSWEFDHGEHCDCVILAAAVGAGPKSISFQYCRDVLQKHWLINCRHGEHAPGETVKVSERWRDVGKIDPLKVILIKEG